MPIFSIFTTSSPDREQGGNSNVTTDYDVMLNALANDYPEALIASLDGATQALREQKAELARLQKGAALCAKLGLECHMGHGLSYGDVGPIAAIPEVRELETFMHLRTEKNVFAWGQRLTEE